MCCQTGRLSRQAVARLDVDVLRVVNIDTSVRFAHHCRCCGGAGALLFACAPIIETPYPVIFHSFISLLDGLPVVATGLAGAALAAPLLGRTLRRTVWMALLAGGAPLATAAFALLSGSDDPQGSATAAAAHAEALAAKVMPVVAANVPFEVRLAPWRSSQLLPASQFAAHCWGPATLWQGPPLQLPSLVSH